MKREDIIKRIKELEAREFIINMIDRWTEEDKRMMAEIANELRTLRAQVA